MKVVVAPDIFVALLVFGAALASTVFRSTGRGKPKKSARKRRPQKDKWQILFEKYPRPTWVFDEKTLHFLAVSEQAVRHYGYSTQEFLSMTIKDISLDADVPRLLECLATAGTPDSWGIWTHRKQDGSLIGVELFLERIDFGGKPAWLGVAQEVAAAPAGEAPAELLRTIGGRLQGMRASISGCLRTLGADGQGGIAYRHLSAFARKEGRPKFLKLSPGRWLGIVRPEDGPGMKKALDQILKTGLLDNDGARPDSDVQNITFPWRAEEAFGRLLRLQDEERRRLARELHEVTAQSLAALIMNLGLLQDARSALGDRERRALSESLALAKECSRQVRTFSYVLHPPLLDEIGLASALSWFVEGFTRRSGIQVDIELPPDLGRFPHQVETTLFRIVQECFTNILWHSGSSTASVRVCRQPNRVLLEVADRGKGIPLDVLRQLRRNPASLGVGITGMQERLRQLRGTLQIDSNGSGTKVRVSVPVGNLKPGEAPTSTADPHPCSAPGSLSGSLPDLVRSIRTGSR